MEGLQFKREGFGPEYPQDKVRDKKTGTSS